MTHQIQIDDLVRGATLDEIEAIEARQAEAIAEAEAKAAKAEAKATARQAILERLGLTEEEAQLILGGSN
jgi:hypothetical protein